MTSPRILITGASGFVGKHLTTVLKQFGDTQIWGVSRQPAESDWPTGVQHVTLDLLDAEHVKKTLHEIQPDQIYHLAGQASVAQSWKAPANTYTQNIQSQVNLLEALVALQMSPRVLISCSSDEYGAVDSSELPVKESQPFRPLSPYGISKVAQDLMGYQYFRSFGIPMVRARAFNHTGPGRPASYAISGFAYQIARMEKGLQPPVLSVGNLEIRRDYLDVRDVVQAYRLCMEKGEPGEAYNVCSGKAHSLQEIVDTLLVQSKVTVTIQQDPARLRPADFPLLYGTSSKLKDLTGWKPTIPIDQMATDLLNYWRNV